MAKYYVSPHLLDTIDKKRPDYADPEHDGNLPDDFKKELNNRLTYHPDGILKKVGECKEIRFDAHNRPVNPLPSYKTHDGRGDLGKWGAQHAADPVAFKFENGQWYVLLVLRSDVNKWALPGGMVDPGENSTIAAARELREEGADLPRDILETLMTKEGKVVYQGINASDPRNTRNAWIETSVVAFMLPDSICRQMRLRPQAGETLSSRWINVNSNLSKLYSDHGAYVELACQKLNIHRRTAWWAHIWPIAFLDTDMHFAEFMRFASASCLVFMLWLLWMA